MARPGGSFPSSECRSCRREFTREPWEFGRELALRVYGSVVWVTDSRRRCLWGPPAQLLRVRVRVRVLTGRFLPSGLEEEQRLLSVVKQLELELSHLRSELSQGQHLTPSCEKVDAIHEKVRFPGFSVSFYQRKEHLS